VLVVLADRQRKNERPGKKRMYEEGACPRIEGGRHLIMFCFQTQSMKESEEWIQKGRGGKNRSRRKYGRRSPN
jgi:hypothetical protein